jgi:hypothetical protein
MDTTTPTVVNEFNAQELADAVNARFAAGEKLTVGGLKVRSWSKTSAAKAWGTGSLSVDVQTRKGNSVSQVWFKVGQTFALDA